MSSALSLFDLAKELVRAHERSAPGVINVIPVIVDDLHLAQPVLEALCAVTEGRLFRTSDDDLRSEVLKTPDIIRRAAVETALVSSDGTRRVVLSEPRQGYLDARFEPATGAEPSPGEAAVLAVARAVVHGELDERRLAVVTYSESAIDYMFRQCLWSLVVDQLTDMRHDTLRTLIFVVEANIDIRLHCQTGRGFRFAINGSRLLRRHGRDDLNVAVTHIARKDSPVVFFLGAGFSASSQLPLGNTLRDTAIRRLLGIQDAELISSDQLGLRFYRWVAERENWLTAGERAMREDEYVQQLTLEQVIRAEKRYYNNLPTLLEFRERHDAVVEAPGPAVLHFAHVLERLPSKAVIVEVNFDCLVERHARVPVRVFYSDSQFAEAAEYLHRYLAGDEVAVPVLKLHGSIEEPETCVASDEQTQQGLAESKLEALRVLIETQDRLWVYVGASMRDRDLLPVFRSVEFARKLDERWVSPFLDTGVEIFAQDRIPFWAGSQLKTIDDRLITETADAFFGALRRELPE